MLELELHQGAAAVVHLHGSYCLAGAACIWYLQLSSCVIRLVGYHFLAEELLVSVCYAPCHDHRAVISKGLV